MRSLLMGVATGASLACAQAAEPPALRPPTADEQRPRATTRHAPDRADDIIWENDKVAHRIYGPVLQKIEPPSGSGIDAWAKKVRWPFMDRQLKTPNYHNDYGEGMDFYSVGNSRGVGGLGIWFDDKLWVSRNWASHKILQNGPDVASFQVTYAPWPVSVDRKVWETRTFTLPSGTHFTRLQSVIQSDKPEELIVGIGLSKTPVGTAKGSLLADAKKGLMVFWSPAHARYGAIGTAVRVDPDMVVDTGADADNHLIRIRVTPGKPFVYYIGSVWEQGLDFNDRAAWEAHVAAERLDFLPK